MLSVPQDLTVWWKRETYKPVAQVKPSNFCVQKNEVKFSYRVSRSCTFERIIRLTGLNLLSSLSVSWWHHIKALSLVHRLRALSSYLLPPPCHLAEEALTYSQA